MHGHLEKWPCCCKSHTLEENRVQKRAKTRVQKRAKTRVQKRPPSPHSGVILTPFRQGPPKAPLDKPKAKNQPPKSREAVQRTLQFHRVDSGKAQRLRRAVGVLGRDHVGRVGADLKLREAPRFQVRTQRLQGPMAWSKQNCFAGMLRESVRKPNRIRHDRHVLSSQDLWKSYGRAFDAGRRALFFSQSK